jgi:hypothetical protein
MRRVLLFLAVLVSTSAGVVAGFFIDSAWNHRAAVICTQESEKPPGAATASGYSIEWEWSEFAYICSYRAPGVPENVSASRKRFSGRRGAPKGIEGVFARAALSSQRTPMMTKTVPGWMPRTELGTAPSHSGP